MVDKWKQKLLLVHISYDYLSGRYSTMASFRIALPVLVVVAYLAGDGGATLKGDFCSDVSFWDRVSYSYEDRCCDAASSKPRCQKRVEEVCKEVTETKCEATAWVECKPDTSNAKRGTCSGKYKDFQQRKCKKVPYNVPHTKKVPKCETKTKENCVTEWAIDDNGNKVWTGGETCEPVTWEECKIVEQLVDFPAEKTECSTAAVIKYLDFEEGPGSSDGLQLDCKVRKAVDCKPVKTNKCATVTFQDCTVEPDSECAAPFTVAIPQQAKVHAKKCLT